MPLTPEQAREHLDRLAVAEPEARREGRIRRLGRRTADAARAVLDYHRYADECGQLLDELPEAERRDAFSALHPQLGDLIGTAWTVLGGDPYPTGWDRRAFRAPRNAGASRTSRIQWLHAVVNNAAPYEQPPDWFAVWAGRLNISYEAPMGRLLAVAIDQGDSDVLDALLATVHGGHEIALMGRHVSTAPP